MCPKYTSACFNRNVEILPCQTVGHTHLICSSPAALATSEGTIYLQTSNTHIQHSSDQFTTILLITSFQLQTSQNSWSLVNHILEATAPRLKMSERAFNHAAVAIWNTLPLMIRECETVETFRKHLKTCKKVPELLSHTDEWLFHILGPLWFWGE